MIWLTSKLNVNPSDDRTVIVQRFLSRLCASVFPVAQFRTTLAVGTFSTHLAKDGVGSRYWLEVRGTKGTIHLGFGILPVAMLCEDPSGLFGQSKAAWQPITSAGVGKPEPLTAKELDNGNILIVNDLIDAIEKDRAPLDSLHDGRAALEMILAVYESHRLERAVDLPLKNRKHPLAAL